MSAQVKKKTNPQVLTTDHEYSPPAGSPIFNKPSHQNKRIRPQTATVSR